MHAAVPQLRQPALRLPLLAWAAFAFTLNLTFTPQNALAQRPEPPRLALDFRGPVGKTFTLGFLHDGRRFFAAGENKVLQFYDIVDRRIIPAAPIRWEFARGALGEINAAAITADSHQGLLAGSSARGAGGDILLVDTGTQAVLDVLSANTEVVSLIANRDASVIAASNRLGGVLLFKRGSDAKFIRSELHPTASDNPADNSPLRTFHPLAFASNKYLLCFLPIGSADNQTDQLTAFDLDNVGTVKTLESFTQLATSLAVSPDGQLIFAGDADGGLVIRRNGLDSPAETASLNQLLQIPADTLLTLRSLTLSPDATLLAALGDLESETETSTTNSTKTSSFLSLLDAASLKLLDRIEFPGLEACRAAAFSPDSSRLLSHNNHLEELLVWELNKNAVDAAAIPDNRLPQPLQQPPASAKGRGRIFHSARFTSSHSSADTGYQLILQDSADKSAIITLGDSGLEESESIAPNTPDTSPIPTNNPDTFATGWTVTATEPAADGLSQELLVRPPPNSQVAPIPIRLSIPDQGIYSEAYTFIRDPSANDIANPNATPSQIPFAVAIGTRTIDGIFVYRLPQKPEQPPELIRYFRDHSSGISSLSVSTDQHYLVSAAPDKTVRIWSLAGIDLPRPQAVLGGQIERTPQNQVLVRNPLKAGILYARGIRDGDAITHLAGLSTNEQILTDPAQIENILLQHPAFRIIDLWTSRSGFNADRPGDNVLRINTGWEPLLTLVSDKTGEWVLFTPEGYFDASIAEGDRLFGWQINQGPSQPPRFEPAEHLQQEYEKPEVIRQVLTLGNVPDALAALNRPPAAAADLRLELRQRVLELPRIEILSPPDGARLPQGQAIPIQAQVSFTNPADAPAFEIQASHNGRLLPEPVIAGPPDNRTYTWQSQLPDSANAIVVSARRPDAELANTSQGRDQTTFFTAGRARDPNARVYLLAFAVDQYLKSAPLQFSVSSVQSFRKDLENAKPLTNPLSPLSTIVADSGVSWKSVTGTLADFLKARQSQPSPDDLVIVVVCGRGISRAVSVGGSLRTGVAEEFFFLPPEVDPRDLAQLDREGVRWKDLCRPINKLDCDVLWIIDAAHSARARNEAKSAFAECRSPHGRNVLFADRSDPVEAATLQVHPNEPGNTALILAIREALVGSDLNSDVQNAVAALWNDQTLTFDDLANYSATRAAAAAKTLGKSQKVIATPTAPNSHLHPLILGNRPQK